MHTVLATLRTPPFVYEISWIDLAAPLFFFLVIIGCLAILMNRL